MTRTQEETQRKIVQAEKALQDRLYGKVQKRSTIFPAFAG